MLLIHGILYSAFINTTSNIPHTTHVKHICSHPHFTEKKKPTSVSDFSELMHLVRGKSRIDSGTLDSKANVCCTACLPLVTQKLGNLRVGSHSRGKLSLSAAQYTTCPHSVQFIPLPELLHKQRHRRMRSMTERSHY